jgi:hypothetical protein
VPTAVAVADATALVGVQDCTDTELHRRVLKYMNDKLKAKGSDKEFSLSVDRFRIIKRSMGNIKRFGAKSATGKKRKVSATVS